MRTTLLLVAVVAVATLAGGQTNSARIAAKTVADGGRVTNVPVQGSGSQRRVENQQIVILRGDVTVTTDAAVIHADEAVYHRDTNRAELRGNVSVQLAALPIISK